MFPLNFPLNVLCFHSWFILIRTFSLRFYLLLDRITSNCCVNGWLGLWSWICLWPEKKNFYFLHFSNSKVCIRFKLRWESSFQIKASSLSEGIIWRNLRIILRLSSRWITGWAVKDLELPIDWFDVGVRFQSDFKFDCIL